MNGFSIREASGPDLETIRALFSEYQTGLGIDLGFQGFASETENPFAKYLEIVLAESDDQVAGCAALRDLGHGIAEIKRLYVRPAFRRRGLARILSEDLIERAASRGFDAIRLDTLRRIPGALELYRSLGFEEIEAYNENPEPDIVYLEKRIA